MNTSRSQHPKGSLLVLHRDESTALDLLRRLGDEYAIYHADSIASARRMLQRRPVDLVLISDSISRTVPSLRRLLEEFPGVSPMLIRDSGAPNATEAGISMQSIDIDDDIAHAIERAMAARHDTAVKHDTESPEAHEAHGHADQSELFGTAVHDLRNPLSVILGLSELMLQDEFSADEVQQFITAIKNNAGEMHRLLDDLQEVTRMDRGRAHVAPAEVPMHAFLQEVTDRALDSAGRVLPIDLDLTEAPDVWRFDRERMTRALLGLLTDNGSTGRSTVVARTQDGALEIVLEQPGRLPSQEELDDIRDGFRRGRRNRGLDEPGTGLGLALAARVVQAHGGTLTVDVAAGRGLVFQLRLPSA